MIKFFLLCFALSGIDSAKRGDYEAAIPLLNLGEKVVPKELHHKFYFYKTTAEFLTLKKDAALASSFKFFESFDKPPVRYEHLIYGMQDDLKKWGKEPLSDIARKMGEVSRRLQQAKGGEATQEKQNEIVKDLDKLIKEIEDEKQAKAGAQAQENDKNGKEKAEGQSTTPANDSVVMGGKGNGKVDEKELRKIAESWGTLPPQKRAQVIKEITRELPPKFKPMIEQYFEALNKLDKR